MDKFKKIQIIQFQRRQVVHKKMKAMERLVCYVVICRKPIQMMEARVQSMGSIN
ncbi:unnamed protein product [Paramecium octaurelia]|uniref:Uncharacterized protein n=1 Tax=Paramecium octaurelia TaxID=43137 RepID=A0A8S1RTZ7_PAROT|nr:unnamed protein product [Paramecium octaurelia]